MNKLMVALLLLAFLLSRLVTLNSNPIFFDSQEYLIRLSDPNYLNALLSGHSPLHPGYILIFWPIFQLSNIIGINPADSVVIVQIILSLISIYCFFKFTEIITNKSLALYSSMLISLTPLYWISNVSIMMETAYVVFFIFSLYFLAIYLTSKKVKNLYFILSVLSFGLSFFTHIATLFWLPLYLYIIYMLKRESYKKFIVILLIIISIFATANGYLISLSRKITVYEGLIDLFFGKMGERAVFHWTIEGITIYIRNFLIPLLRNNTNIIVALALASLIKMYFKDKRIFFLSFLWIAPSFIANQWWDSLFFGRHSLIAGFGLAFLASYLIDRKRIVILFTILYMIITSLPAVSLLKTDIPYLKEAETIKTLPKGGLLIESHFARPQVSSLYRGKIIYVGEPGFYAHSLISEINERLQNKKPVFISAQALSEPYGLYSGPYLHSLSLSYEKGPMLKPVIENFTLEKYREINREDNLIIYKIKSYNPSAYPHISSMKFHRRRLDFFDPLSQLWFFINNVIALK